MTISELIRRANLELTHMIAENIVHNYSRDCAVDTGTLQREASYEINDVFNITINLQFYWKYLEWGTKRGIQPHLTFTNSFDEALEFALVENDDEDVWLRFAKQTLAKHKNMLHVKITDTNYPRVRK